MPSNVSRGVSATVTPKIWDVSFGFPVVPNRKLMTNVDCVLSVRHQARPTCALDH